MENYTALIQGDTPATLDATLPALERLGVSTHTLDELPDHADLDMQEQLLAKDVGYYSVIGALSGQRNDQAIYAHYTLGISTTEQGMTVRGIMPDVSRMELLGEVSTPKELGVFVVRTLHPFFLAEARLHSIRQRAAA